MNLEKKLYDILAINKSNKLSIQSLLATIISSMLAFYFLIIHGYTNPDGICEGLNFYKNADWALGGCGRWAIRYLNELSCNIVSPLLVILGYSICIWLSIIFLAKLWSLSNPSIIALSVIMIVTPTVAEQITYTYTALAYSFACLFSVLSIYFIFNHKMLVGFLGSAISITIMLGLYQSYVGMVAVLFIMTIILKLFSSEEPKKLLLNSITALLATVVGVFLNGIILKAELARWELDNSGSRVSEFNISTIFESLHESLPYVYNKYWNSFQDSLMHRNILYNFTLLVVVLLLIFNIIKLIKNKKFIQSCLATLFILLIPMASNLIGILIPYNEVGSIMHYQTILIIPFMFSCLDQFKEMKTYTILRLCSILLTFIISWTYILGANATLKCYELSYNHINTQMEIAISRIYNLDGYEKNITPIIMAGFPNDTTLKNNMDIFQYGENLHSNPVFWENFHGATNNRYLYFMNYFGIDAVRFQDEDYVNIVNSSEFASMPIWPATGSVQIIQDCAVIKFSENPAMP